MMPTMLTPATAPERFVAGFGHHYKPGVLSEQVDLFVAAGGVVRTSASGTGLQWALPGGKAAAVPVVCSEVIEINTEDGPASGRCGIPAVREGCCEGHAEERASWMEMSEAERAFWERERG